MELEARGIIKCRSFDGRQCGESHINIHLGDASPAIRTDLAAGAKQ